MKLNHKIRAFGFAGVTVLTAMIPTQSMACSSQPYIGGMCAFGGNFAIRSWALTNGQLLAIQSNQALFSILGTTYGGDGRTTFGLPDLRGRSAIGQGQGPGLQNYSLGQNGGAETMTLSLNNLPIHSHAATTNVATTIDTSGSSSVLRALAGDASTNTPGGNVLANSPSRENIYSNSAPTVDMSSSAIDLVLNVSGTSTATTTIGTAGGSTSFSIRDPYLAVNWQIALQGIFPPRN